uniref:Uncharacterized protein n=1 Tax=Oryza rufipogon TaxID=4529 RepID=A0A0E0R3U1_ORYRU
MLKEHGLPRLPVRAATSNLRPLFSSPLPPLSFSPSCPSSLPPMGRKIKVKKKKASSKVWQPGVDTLEEGEELQFDPQAYNYLRGFDVVRDQLGLAERATWNYIGIFKICNINGKKREPIPASAIDGDSDMDSESSSDEEDEAVNEDTMPILHVWDFSPFLNSLAESGAVAHNEDDRIHNHWSPTEADIFASCSADRTISIWDIRTGKKPCISVRAHNADVNVISWNRNNPRGGN